MGDRTDDELVAMFDEASRTWLVFSERGRLPIQAPTLRDALGLAYQHQSTAELITSRHGEIAIERRQIDHLWSRLGLSRG